jgi:biopolymer transport protein ExbB
MHHTPLLANVLVDTFIHGGIIMWPLLALSFLSLGIVVERTKWYLAARRARSPQTLAQVYAALAHGDTNGAQRIARGSADPRVRVISHGLEHAEIDVEIATEIRAEEEVKIGRRFLGALDTIITLAPLLGLLGTVVGIMHSFQFVGADQELAVSKVSGGIGEALIATAFGLGIAIFTLIPFNFLGHQVEDLEVELETVGKNVRLLLQKHQANSRVNHSHAHIERLSEIAIAR